MEKLQSRLELLTWIGLAVAGLGVSVAIVRSWVEYLYLPSGRTLVDGYWAGTEPWTSLGTVTVLTGAVLTLLAGTALVLVRGDWLRRLLVLPLLALPAIWWAWALGFLPYPRFQGPDPVTLAYSVPEQAAIMLLVPAIGLAVLAFLPIRHDTRLTFAPVPRDPREERNRRIRKPL